MISIIVRKCYGLGLERPERGARNTLQIWVHAGHGPSNYMKGDNVWQCCRNIGARLSQCYRKVSSKRTQHCRNIGTTTPGMSVLIRNTQKDYITNITLSILETSLNSQFNSYHQLNLTKHRTTNRLTS